MFLRLARDPHHPLSSVVVANERIPSPCSDNLVGPCIRRNEISRHGFSLALLFSGAVRRPLNQMVRLYFHFLDSIESFGVLFALNMVPSFLTIERVPSSLTT